MNSPISWSVTGHQPHLLGGFTEKVEKRLLRLARGWLADRKPARVISGMAAGWDMAVATAAVEAGVPLVAALAWPGQGDGWPEDARLELHRLLHEAVEVYEFSPTRVDGMWTGRDHWAIMQGDAVIALWSGEKGGTGRAVAYANSLGKPVKNLWDEWLAIEPGLLF